MDSVYRHAFSQHLWAPWKPGFTARMRSLQDDGLKNARSILYKQCSSKYNKRLNETSKDNIVRNGCDMITHSGLNKYLCIFSRDRS